MIHPGAGHSKPLQRRTSGRLQLGGYDDKFRSERGNCAAAMEKIAEARRTVDRQGPLPPKEIQALQEAGQPQAVIGMEMG